MKISQQLLKTAGILTFGVALFQAVISSSPEWSRYFGAGEILTKNIWVLYSSGLFVTTLFAICAFYAFSGIGAIRRLPLLRTGLIVTGIVFTLRGLAVITETLIFKGVIKNTILVQQKDIIVSSVALIIGLLYIAGIIWGWKLLPVKTKVN